jgi:hypothetical protein
MCGAVSTTSSAGGRYWQTALALTHADPIRRHRSALIDRATEIRMRGETALDEDQ